MNTEHVSKRKRMNMMITIDKKNRQYDLPIKQKIIGYYYSVLWEAVSNLELEE